MLFKTKRFLTLIELLIAMALTTLVLSVLFYFYRDIDWLNQDMEKSQREAFRLSYVQSRLSDILPNIVSPRTEIEDFFFYVSHEGGDLFKQGNPSLVFTYNFGANRNPQFANHVIGRLYLDPYNNFYLATLPSPKQWSPTSLEMKKELLLENVESLAFKFYVPPEKDRSNMGNKAPKGGYAKGKSLSTDIQPKNSWHTDWKNEYHQLPAMIKVILEIKNQNEPFIFTYPLPSSDFQIIYDK